MSNVSPSVQPAAWRLPDLPDELRYIDTLHMPTSMFHSLLGLKTVIPNIPPFVSLHDLLGAHSRLIVAFEPDFWKQNTDNPPWLYATDSGAIGKERLRTLIQTWVTASYNDSLAQNIVAMWNPLHWSHRQIDLATAEDSLRRRLLPGLVARWLLKQNHHLTLQSRTGLQTMPLRLITLMADRHNAVLMTDPQSLGGQLVSFGLRFWLETMPPNGEMLLFHRAFVRRWLSQPLINEKTGYVEMQYRRNRSVYYRRPSGYLDRQAQGDVYSCIKLRYSGGDVNGLHWIGNHANVFQHISPGETFPTVQQFITDLKSYQPSLLLPMQSRDARWSKVSSGLKAADHLQILTDLEAQFANFADLVPSWTRATQGDARIIGWRSSNHRARKQVSGAERYSALEAMPQPLCIEMHTGDIVGAKRALLSAVGIDPIPEPLDQSPYAIQAAGGQVLLEIVPREDSSLTELLPIVAETGGAARRNAEDNRQREIAKQRPNRHASTGVLVMLRDYRGTALKKRDPKKAIRGGLIQAGRVSQFYTPPKKGEADEAFFHRTENAVADLLRQLGYRYAPYYTRPIKSALPESLDIMAFWLLQRNAKRGEKTLLLPLAIETLAGQSQLQVYLPRSTGTPECYPTLAKALVAAAALESDFDNTEQTVNFFRTVIAQRQSQNPTLLLLAEQNLRRVLFDLHQQTGATTTLNGILDNAQSIRVARLSFSKHDEAPFCLPGAGHGKYQGLYEHVDYPNVYFSLHNLPASLIKPSIKHYKLDMWNKPAPNPSTLQIHLNNLQPDDIPVEWATIVHRLRMESSHTDAATLYPQPIHDLMILYKYVARLVVETADQEFGDEE